MASLEIPVSIIPDPGLRVDTTVAARDLRPAEAPGLPLERISVRGVLSPLVGQYLFQGTVEALFVHPCDRCLEAATVPVSLSVVWTFEEGAPREKSAVPPEDAEMLDVEEEACGVFSFDGMVIDLARPAWDEAVLALPSKFICRDNCRGLCPQCGANRNMAPCTCEEVVTEEQPASESGFAGLKDLFPDLPE